MTELETTVATRLLTSKSLKMQPNNPFEWGKGVTSPIYFDSRNLLSYPQVRIAYKQELAQLIRDHYADAQAIASIAPNSIAIGIMVAEELGLPFVYVTPRPKGHGLENMIEGQLKPRQKVVIVEDQVSFGKNCTKVKDILVKDGSIVLGMVTMYCHELEEGAVNLANANLTCHALTKYTAVMEQAKANNMLTDAALKKIEEWHANPLEWKK